VLVPQAPAEEEFPSITHYFPISAILGLVVMSS